ncbi:MAG: hypothetical protein OEL83_12665 [Desulforhopalus sp.]|nr:hypothetical protein [Desulforhopalus sp.]
MKESKQSERPRTRVKARAKRAGFVWFFLIAVSVLIALLYHYKRPELIRLFDDKASITSFISSVISPQVKSTDTKSSANGQLSSTSPTSKNVQPATEKNQDATSQENIQTQADSSVVNQEISGKESSAATADSPKPSLQGAGQKQLVDELNAFYAHLDQQSYMHDFQLKEPSKKHFSKLLQVLIDNPPAITRETDDYFTLLKNTAHFFRVLGKDNIFILKGILDREKDSFERIIKTFYLLTEHPESLKSEFSLTIPEENLYDYAGFFLNTIGGRLYLFRRDSASRMTISYYAVLVIDRANRKGNSRLGIDLRPSIDSLIEEIENAGKNLKLKDEYLDTLYDLKENYGSRG